MIRRDGLMTVRVGGRAASRRAAVLGVMAAIVSVLTACASIPSSGPVHGSSKITSKAGNTPAGIAAAAYGPEQNDPPGIILQGFLMAMQAGQTDNFQAARMYLTPSAAHVWDPSAQTVVYSSDNYPQWSIAPQPSDGSQTASITFGKTATVNANGTYFLADPSTASHEEIQLVQNSDKQWRISSLPAGILIPQIQLQSAYRQATIYFPDATGTYAIPDERWFPARTEATDIVKAFLAGPSSYVAPAVQNVVPKGTRLAIGAVTISNGTALVNLSAEATGATPSQRTLLVGCIESSLLQVPAISDVSIQVKSSNFDAPRSTRPLVVNPLPTSDIYYVSQGTLRQFQYASGRTNDANFQSGAFRGLTSLSVNPQGTQAAGLEANGAVGLVSRGSKSPTTLDVSGGQSVAPQFDPRGWLWTGPATNMGQVQAFGPTGQNVAVQAPWLHGRTLLGLVPAYDGVRMLVIARSADGKIDIGVSGITRAGSSSGSPPVSLTDPLIIGITQGSVATASWTDDVTIAALTTANGSASAAPSVSVWQVGGPSSTLSTPPQTAWITGGQGLNNLYISVSNGDMYVRETPGWQKVATGVSFPTFAP